MAPGTVITLKIILICAVGFVANFAIQRGLRAASASGIFGFRSHLVASKIVKWAIIIVVTILSIQQFGISVHALWTSISAVFVLIAVGFIAVWSILSNVSSALLLVIFSPFRIGDEIEIIEPAILDPEKRGMRGKVIDISFLYTTIAESSDEKVLTRLPNNIFFQKGIRCRPGKSTESLQDSLFEKKE